MQLCALRWRFFLQSLQMNRVLLQKLVSDDAKFLLSVANETILTRVTF